MIVYLDTSALLKLFVAEPGSTGLRRVLDGAEPVTHLIAYTELRAALAKARRMRRVGADAYSALLADLESSWRQLSIVNVEPPLVRRAGALAERFGLRGYDSVHLAAAELAFTAAGTRILFAAFDVALNAGATELGMDTLADA